MSYFVYWTLFFHIFFVGCTSKSPEYFQGRGRAITDQLIDELQEIHDLDDLIKALPQLQRLFDALADVIIEARKWQIKKGIHWQLAAEDARLSALLRSELNRLFAIPAGRELIEKSEQPALERLDAFEKKLQKKL